eukprot:GHRQ01040005.1.p1 GENE.GHRQ01040005.1~~GHRQ01040005.1.p1  ORF type:complete len:113 (+),score=37.46 GHRQ01040005.1:361-699(+)
MSMRTYQLDKDLPQLFLACHDYAMMGNLCSNPPVTLLPRTLLPVLTTAFAAAAADAAAAVLLVTGAAAAAAAAAAPSHLIFDSVKSTRLLTSGSNLTRCSLYGTLRGFFFVT